MAEPTAPPEQQPVADPATVRRGRRTILLIAAVCIAPIVASYSAYYLFPRDAKVNYGTLLPTGPVPPIEGTSVDGSPFRLADLAGRWVLVVAADDQCAAACETVLHATRQARTMQGREQERVVRVLLVGEGNVPTGALLASHPGLIAARVSGGIRSRLGDSGGAIYLIDPLGNLVLRYGEDPDIKGIARDLTRLLKASRIG